MCSGNFLAAGLEETRRKQGSCIAKSVKGIKNSIDGPRQCSPSLYAPCGLKEVGIGRFTCSCPSSPDVRSQSQDASAFSLRLLFSLYISNQLHKLVLAILSAWISV